MKTLLWTLSGEEATKNTLMSMIDNAGSAGSGGGQPQLCLLMSICHITSPNNVLSTRRIVAGLLRLAWHGRILLQSVTLTLLRALHRNCGPSPAHGHLTKVFQIRHCGRRVVYTALRSMSVARCAARDASATTAAAATPARLAPFVAVDFGLIKASEDPPKSALKALADDSLRFETFYCHSWHYKGFATSRKCL